MYIYVIKLKHMTVKELIEQLSKLPKDKQVIFNEALKFFPHLNNFRILNMIVDSISHNNSNILYNFLLKNIFYNDEIDIIFHYAKLYNLKNILQILFTHYSYKIYCIDDLYYMKDIDIIYKSVCTHLLKNMKIAHVSNYSECTICYNSCNRIVKLDCHDTHLFCEDCLNKWMISNMSCPLCRQNININNANLIFALCELNL